MSERFHALDACRAAAMLLGVYLHAALPYRPHVGEAWPFDDAAESAWMAASVEVIHSFRMQLFFLLAGFFAALLIERRGWRGLARNRLVRIAIPYAVGILVLSPLCLLAWMWAAGEWEYVSARSLAAEIGGSWHLWFLRELLVFAALSCAVAVAVPRRWLRRVGDRAGRVLMHPLGPLALAGVVWGTLLVQPWWGIHGPGFWPRWESLLHYGMFYAAGAAMWPLRSRVGACGRRWWAWGLVAAAVIPAWLWGVEWFGGRGGFGLSSLGEEPLGAGLVIRAAYALMGVSLAFAFLGVFVRFFARPSAAWRYVSDASYWAYLIHYPLVIVASRLVMEWDAPAWAKAMAVLGMVCPVLIGTYAVVVRGTWIGRVLNGTPLKVSSRGQREPSGSDRATSAELPPAASAA